VEKFELIATTGKNAKTPQIPFLQSTLLPASCLIVFSFNSYSTIMSLST
jgi:hypothetical protein